MSVDAALRDAIASALRELLPELRAELGRSRLISIRELPVSYRLLLEAERAGEIRVYRRGKFSAVDEAEFIAWMKRAPAATRQPEPVDAIGEIIAANERRHGKRKPRA